MEKDLDCSDIKNNMVMTPVGIAMIQKNLFIMSKYTHISVETVRTCHYGVGLRQIVRSSSQNIPAIIISPRSVTRITLVSTVKKVKGRNKIVTRVSCFMLSFWLAPRECESYSLDSLQSVVLTVIVEDHVKHIDSGSPHLIETVGNQNAMIL